MRERFIQFMQGRYGAYGPDSLNRFLLGSTLAVMVLSVFTRWSIFYWVAIAGLICTYFRMFSRNYTKRYAENQAFLKYTSGLRGFVNTQKNMVRQRRTHHIYKCPNCGQKIRIPRGRGRIAVTCPKCSTEFIKRS